MTGFIDDIADQAIETGMGCFEAPENYLRALVRKAGDRLAATKGHDDASAPARQPCPPACRAGHQGEGKEPKMTGPWPVPVEIITRLASPTGISFILRAKLRNAAFKPLGRISVRADRYVGEIDFVEPIGAERQDGIVIMLGIAPGEALTYEVAP